MKKVYVFAWSLISLIIFWLTYSYFSKGFIYSIITSNAQQITSFLKSLGIFAPLIFIGIIILEVVLAPIPPLALYIVAGILFGGFLGGILTLIGNLIGAFIDFKIARKFGKKSIEKSMNKKLKNKFDKFFKKYGIYSIFILRVNPITTSDIVSYLSGLTKIKTWKFMIATGLGLIPMIFIQTYLGDIFIKENSFLIGFIIFFSFVYLLIFIFLILKILIEKNHNSLKKKN
ncbi:MAG: VTT domain-containing protein [Nanoarchaeota archaeon]|nr:VTT domain-containing protein [Nanoarchaeota archaeon]